MPSQILVLMPLGFGPFSFLDPLDPFVPGLYSPPKLAASPDMQLALPRPGLLMPLKVSCLGAAWVLPARLFLKHPWARRAPRCYNCLLLLDAAQVPQVRRLG